MVTHAKPASKPVSLAQLLTKMKEQASPICPICKKAHLNLTN